MNYKAKLHNITTFVFDFDGVMSDGSVWTLPSGETVRNGNARDGYALQLAIKKGYNVVLITGAVSGSIEKRMQSLGVKDVFTGASNKYDIYKAYLESNHVSPQEVLVMGDDIPDYHMMKDCGVATCPADAATEIKEISDYISFYSGGKGCVRDVIEQVLKLKNDWFTDDSFHW